MRKLFWKMKAIVVAQMQSLGMARLSAWIEERELLAVNRRATSWGISIGFLVGIIPLKVAQFAAGAWLCSLVKGNFMVAAVTTLYTNRLTLIPLYLFAYAIGVRLLPGEHTDAGLPPPLTADFVAYANEFSRWMMGLGWPLVSGLAVIAVSLAVVGFIASEAIWWSIARRRLSRWRSLRERAAA